jgi:GH24 family phage-related lysozyme (muramidase)
MNKGQQAALSDVAYQVGDVKQFSKAMSALAAGDHQGFSDALAVTYKGSDGQRHEDVRRNRLRSLAMNGSSAFFQGLAEASRSSN